MLWQLVSSAAASGTHFRDLDWRLEVVVASRSGETKDYLLETMELIYVYIVYMYTGEDTGNGGTIDKSITHI